MQPSKKCRLYCRDGCCNGVAAPGNHLVYWRCNKGWNLHNFTHSSPLATSLPRIYSNSLVGKILFEHNFIFAQFIWDSSHFLDCDGCLIVPTPKLKLVLHTRTSADSRPAENGGDEKATFAIEHSPDTVQMIVHLGLFLYLVSLSTTHWSTLCLPGSSFG